MVYSGYGGGCSEAVVGETEVGRRVMGLVCVRLGITARMKRIGLQMLFLVLLRWVIFLHFLVVIGGRGFRLFFGE